MSTVEAIGWTSHFYAVLMINIVSFIIDVNTVFNSCMHLILFQALLHASVACSQKPSIQWVSASDLEDAAAASVSR